MNAGMYRMYRIRNGKSYVAAGARVVTDPEAECDADLRWEALAKDSILSLFG